ncbi:MAG: restriction endonuclease, partial [Candidatus Parabeggiatoa sp. nov. 1]
PRLFGIKHSNRDFSNKESWGKNQFNSSFPVALACYMSDKGFENVYLKLDNNLKVSHDTISSESLFGMVPHSEMLFFAFETPYTPYQQLLIGNMPRDDLVTQNSVSGNCLRGVEIKLTALPDNATCDLSENRYGCELVIRPDTIVYLACGIAMLYKNEVDRLKKIIGNDFENIVDWTEPNEVLPYVPKMVRVIEHITLDKILFQEPFIMQPIWKTVGKSPILANHCLDIFVWSNFAFTRLFLGMTTDSVTKINRSIRTIIWLFKMLYDFSQMGQIDYSRIIDELSFNTKNDKAFAVNGKITYPYMKSEFLTKPRIPKSEIKHIILGKGQNLLSPERRFDAIIYNSPDLF